MSSSLPLGDSKWASFSRCSPKLPFAVVQNVILGIFLLVHGWLYPVITVKSTISTAHVGMIQSRYLSINICQEDTVIGHVMRIESYGTSGGYRHTLGQEDTVK